jgi:3-oxoacyl-[acyl-carrier-protein] synthase-1
MTRRVAITGVGIVSSLGHSYGEVTSRLRAGISGIRSIPEWEELGLRSSVAGTLGDLTAKKKAAAIPKRLLLSMSEAALYCALAAQDAVKSAGLGKQDLAHAACIVGNGVGSTNAVYEGGCRVFGGRANRVNPFTVLMSMASSPSASVAHLLGIGGRSYSFSSACATSNHAIGHAFELIRHGGAEIAIAGGGEELTALLAGAFNALRTALSSHYNETPERASRPFDRDRDGFVLSGGAGIVVLEDLARARARGVTIYGEVAGFAANTDRFDMVLPEPDGRTAAACFCSALESAGIHPGEVDYVNAHATSTTAGDLAEIEALRRVFGSTLPPLSSTKSMGGHAIGAVGALEVIHCLAMMQNGFLAPSINIDNLDPALEGVPIVTETTPAHAEVVVSNSFGFGGTNGVLVLRRFDRS